MDRTRLTVTPRLSSHYTAEFCSGEVRDTIPASEKEIRVDSS